MERVINPLIRPESSITLRESELISDMAPFSESVSEAGSVTPELRAGVSASPMPTRPTTQDENTLFGDSTEI